ELQVAQNPGGISLSRHKSRPQKRSQLRSKNEGLGRLVVIERLDSHGIARQQEPLSRRIPEGKGKHAAQPRQAGLAPHPIGSQNYFRVGMAVELGADTLKFLAKLAEVVDLAVEDDPIAGDRIRSPAAPVGFPLAAPCRNHRVPGARANGWLAPELQEESGSYAPGCQRCRTSEMLARFLTAFAPSYREGRHRLTRHEQHLMQILALLEAVSADTFA